jgi:CDGSH-type Zn-finger protein
MLEKVLPRVPTKMLVNRKLVTVSLGLRLTSCQGIHTSQQTSQPKRWKDKSAPPFQHQLKNPVEVVYGGAEKWPQDQFGKLYDKKPFKVSVTKYHMYRWCGCGVSHSQPFCDETCVNPYYKKQIVGGYITYIAPEDRDIWFCNCKRTQHRPFCDGSHRNPEIQETRLDAKFELWEPTEKGDDKKHSKEDEEEEIEEPDSAQAAVEEPVKK